MKHVSLFPIGRGSDPGSFIGPIQNKVQYERVTELLADVKAKDQKVLLGGGISQTDQTKNGYFIQPTIVDRPADASDVVTKEAFGPVIPLLEWSDTEEVITRVNASDMGLGASVWAKDLALAQNIGEELEVGSVWINKALAIQPTAAFGGHKKSGIGREWGVEGLRGFCNTRTLFRYGALQDSVKHDSPTV